MDEWLDRQTDRLCRCDKLRTWKWCACPGLTVWALNAIKCMLIKGNVKKIWPQRRIQSDDRTEKEKFKDAILLPLKMEERAKSEGNQ